MHFRDQNACRKSGNYIGKKGCGRNPGLRQAVAPVVQLLEKRLLLISAPMYGFSVASESVNAAAGSFSITVTTPVADNVQVTVPFTLGGTATSGTDYSGISASPLVFPTGVGAKTQTINGTLTPDAGPNPTLVFTLHTPSGGKLGTNTVNTLTIIEPAVTFSAPSETVNESTGTFSIQVALTGTFPSDVSVPFTLGGTAVAGTDYSGVSASPVVIPAGQTSATITGTLLDDTSAVSQTLTFTMGTPTGAPLGTQTVNTLTIVQPAVHFSAGSETINESTGAFSIPVVLNQIVGVDVSVPFALGGTATSGTDYSGVTTSPLVIPAGQTTGTISGTLNNDPGINQTLTVTLGTPTNAAIGSPAVNTLTIAEPAGAAFTTGSETVNESAGTFSVPVTLTGTTLPIVSTFASGFGGPAGLAFDAAGNLYVANYSESGDISEVTPAGVVSTFASGFDDPSGLAFDSHGNLYVLDNNASTLSKVTPAGVVTTLASGLGAPFGLAIDGSGNLYVGSLGNSTVSKVTPGGVVTTFASGINLPYALAFDAAGNLYVDSDQTTTGVVDEVSPSGVVSTFASGLNRISGLGFDAAGNLYVANALVGSVSRVTPAGVVTTFASGFNAPIGLAFDAASNLYVGNEGSTTVSEVGQNATVPFTLGGTAQAGIDYSGVTAGPLLFGPGQATQTITGTLLPDAGPSKTLTLTLGTPTGEGVQTGLASANTLTITEPPGAEPSVQFDSSSETVNESTGTFSITVDQSAPSATDTTIPFTLGGTAVSGTDYSGVTASPLVIPAGQTSGTITGTLLSDAGNPSNLTFTLGTPTNATLGANTENTLSITQPAAPPTVQFDSSAETIDESAGTFSITVDQSAASATDTSIPFTLGGTAVSGTDYSGVSASPVLIPAGQTTGTITGTLLDDPGDSSTLSFTLGTPTNATLGSTTSNTLSITQPAIPPTVQFNSTAESVNESAGTFSITVTQSATSATDTTIPFTLGGTAVSGTDYSGLTSSPITIPAGSTSATITGTLLDDPGNSSTLSFTLGTPTNATLGSTTSNTLSITQPAIPPTVQFNSSAESVNESAGTFSVTVTQSATSATDTSIPFTLGGTAVSGTDYSGLTASPLVIPAGSTSGSITGALPSDYGNSSTLSFTLGTPTNATPGTTTANTLSITQLAPPVLATHVGASSSSISNPLGEGFGQSFTTPAGGPWDDITANFFSDAGSATPEATGNLYLLSEAYTGAPNGLSSSTPGFIAGATTLTSGKHVFSSSVKLDGATQYFVYEDAISSTGTVYHDISNGGGGQTFYITNGSSSGADFRAFSNLEANFEVDGTAVAKAAEPTISSLSPNSGTTGTTHSVNVIGTGFISGDSEVIFDGDTLTTTFDSSTELTASFPNAPADGYSITVDNQAEGETSNSETFTISNTPGPTITSLSPSSGTTGTTHSVNVSGTNFISGTSEVQFSGETLTTTFDSSTELTATFPNAPAYGYSITVIDENDGATSSPQTFTISNPPTAQFSVGIATVDQNAGTFSIPVTLSAAAASTITVPFTVSGTAVSGTDFSGLSSSPLTFPSGTTTQDITGTLIDGGAGLADRTIIFKLGTPSTGAVDGTTTQATLTIHDTDAPISVIQFTGSDSASTNASWNGLGNTYAKAFDGNTNTFFDAPTANGNWVQLDLGSPQTITQIGYAPRVGFESRMIGGIFEASNDPTFGLGVVMLYTVKSSPADGLTRQSVSPGAAYRYVRYVSPTGSYGNIAELQVFGPAPIATSLTGTYSANTIGSYNNAGNTYAKAFDGNNSTFFDAPTANGNWVQINFGSLKTLTQIAYAPRVGFESRMVGGYFEGSDDPTFSKGVTVLYTITSAPADGLTKRTVSGTYQYVRYVSPAGSYGNIAELQVFGTAAVVPAAPGTPTLVSDTPAAATIAWTAPASTGVSGYIVFRNGTQIDTTNSTTLTFPDSSLMASTKYTYTVEAVAGGVDSLPSNPLSVTTPPLPPGTPTLSSSTPTTATIAWTASPTAGVTGYDVLRNGVQIGTTNATTFTYPDTLLNPSTTYSYTVEAVANGIASAPSGALVVNTPASPSGALTGTVIGTPGSYDGKSTDAAAAAFDNNLNTFFDAPTAGTTSSPNWVGLNLGSTYTITSIKFAPRAGFESRMVGGQFQVSNNASFTTANGGVVDTIYTITSAPADGFTTLTIPSAPGAFQYVRYLAPNGSYGNIAELQFFGTPGRSAAKLTGTPSANTTSSYQNNGDIYLNAFDGNTNTFWDAPNANGNYLQLDLGSAKTITQISYAPRVGFESRMAGGIFEASNDPTFGTGVTVLYTITSPPPDGLTTQAISVGGTFRYVRYVAPAGSYGNIAEMQVFGY